MADFAQDGAITTIHHLGTADIQKSWTMLRRAVRNCRIGLVLPLTADDMRAEPFANIVAQVAQVDFLETIVVVVNRTESADDYRETARIVAPLAERVQILWTDGPRGTALYGKLQESGFDVSKPGKGLAVWTAFGYLLGDPRITAFALHDCDIVNYDYEMLVRLCLPIAHPSFDFDFCKAYYARCGEGRMHGRLVRLLVAPLLRALISVLGSDDFLLFLNSFRYPLSGELAITATLARSNRVPSDWGLEVGTLGEVFRNTSQKRVCQVELPQLYEHKHQPLSVDNPQSGLMAMCLDVLTSIIRTLASRGIVFTPGHFISLRSAYVRVAQDAIRKYHADALMNNLDFDRHAEEQAVEAFAEQITVAGDAVYDDPSGYEALPTWTRVLAALPDFPEQLRESVAADRQEYAVPQPAGEKA